MMSRYLVPFVLFLSLIISGINGQFFLNFGAPNGPQGGAAPFNPSQFLGGSNFGTIGNIPMNNGNNGFGPQPGLGYANGNSVNGRNNANGQVFGPGVVPPALPGNFDLNGNSVDGRRGPGASNGRLDDGRRRYNSGNYENNGQGLGFTLGVPPERVPGQPEATLAQTPSRTVNICGSSSYALVQGGEAVQNGEFPWLGALFSTPKDVYMCTVNLVSTKHAITAAHCFPNPIPQNYGIRWGHPRVNRQSNYDNISTISVHPGYNQTTLHDVAVITLTNPITFTMSLKPICLWRSAWSPEKDVTGMVAGFGPNYEDLKKVAIPIVTREACKASNVFFHFATSEYTFCAGTRNEEEGPCKGDSGAGYMQWLQDRYYLRGLVSHSLSNNGNCNLREYIIFADLSRESAWIKKMID